MRIISSFWIAYAAGLVELCAEFRQRDMVETPLVGEELSMEQWLRLPAVEREQIIQGYLASRRRLRAPVTGAKISTLGY